MALAPKNWTKSTYTPDAWTDLVAEPAVLSSIIIANEGATANIKIRIASATNTLVATVLPTRTLEPNEGGTFDARNINLTGTQKLQFIADVGGVSFTASGAA